MLAELIIPGTYITVRAEGLISAGPIATGIVGIVGTAENGPVNTAVTLSGFANARDVYGLPDDFSQPEDGSTPLTLVRALSQLYNNGVSTVIAVRAVGGSVSSATYALQDANGRTIATLTARTPGTWANDMSVLVEAGDADCVIGSETWTATFDKLRYSPVLPSPRNRIRINRGVTKRTDTLDVVYKRIVTNETVTPGAGGRYFLSSTPVEVVANVNLVRVLDSSGALVRQYGDGAIVYGAGAPPPLNNIRVTRDTGEIIFEATQVPIATQTVVATYAVGHADPQSGQVLVTAWDGTLTFSAGEAPQQVNGDTLLASYVVDRSSCSKITLTGGTSVERYIVPDGRLLVQLINQSSRLVTATVDETNGSRQPRTGTSAFFGTGSNTPGNNGASATADDYATALETLSNMLVNIIVLAGQDSKAMGSTLLGHLDSTAETDFERIGVIGAPGGTVDDFLGHAMASDRIVLVGPGMILEDGSSLPSGYTAAAVAGLMSSLPVQASLTNKPLNVAGLSVQFNRGQQEQLILRDILAVVNKEGFRVIKGLTTAGGGTPFSAIPTRRTVDYAKYGVRSGANSYLGRLNNDRVRSALKATLDAFLTRMVQDEALTGYQLEVTATRAQEIAGEVSVVMTLQPTFSIEYIQVTMILK
jgi:hypothetical protein